MVSLSVKSAIASAIAWELGSLLPQGLATYAYYAPIGAVTVMYAALTDSVKEAIRAVAAIIVGLAVAGLVLLVPGPRPLLIALAVGLGTAFSVFRIFGAETPWVPLAALFAITAHRDTTEHFALGYVGQVLVGAVVGLAVNALFFPSLGLSDVHTAYEKLRGLIVGQLTSSADLLENRGDEPVARAAPALRDLSPARERLQQLTDQARRARAANPRSRRWRRVQEDVLTRAAVMIRLSWLVEHLTVSLAEFELGDHMVIEQRLAEPVAEATRAMAQVLAGEAEDRDERSKAALEQIGTVVDGLNTSDKSQEDHLLAMGIVTTLQRCVRTLEQLSD